MKIENLRSERNGDRARVAATVTWEDCDRPALDIYFETEERFREALTCNPHPFLVGSLLPAMHHGEKRVLLDAEICPELRENLTTAMTLVRHWFYAPDHDLVRIEANTTAEPRDRRIQDRTGFFFSGGIDSFGTLCSNRLNYPPGHPGSIRDGLLIYGQNIESDGRPETFRTAFSEMSEVARESGLEFIPVYTNVRNLDESKAMFSINHGAILGAVAHAFSQRLDTMCISSGDSIPGLVHVNSMTLAPHGSHSLLDPCYGSREMRIKHYGLTLSRLDKTRLIAGWDAALNNIRVCGPNYPGRNCGRCEKCIRTMLGLLAAGVLDRSKAFPEHDVTADMVERIRFRKPSFGYGFEQDYLELIDPLKEKGRLDLVEAIQKVMARARNENAGLISTIRDIDRKYLFGTLASARKLVRAKAAGR